jgi:glycosyltransferase involved in cell wall biosynthesis
MTFHPALRAPYARASGRGPLEVLALAYDYPPGHDTGLGTHIAELATGIGEFGIRTTVLVRWRDGSDAPETVIDTAADRFRVHRVPRRARPPNSGEPSEADPAVTLLLDNEDVERLARSLVASGYQPDVIHCHDFFLIPAALRLKESWKVPLIVTVHFLFEPMMRWFGQPLIPGIAELEQAMCGNADAVITVSRSMARLLEQTHHLEADTVRVIYNGFDARDFGGNSAEATSLDPAASGGPGERVIVFVGRIARQKGIRELLQSAETVLAEYPTVQYVLAGPTPLLEVSYRNELLALIEGSERLSTQVSLVGKLPRPELRQLYRRAEMALVPSLYEPFGYAATEAMAMGVPVIASDSGGLAEIVQHGESGLLVPTHRSFDDRIELEVAALATAQLALLRRPEEARRLGRRGQERVRTAFSLDGMLLETAEVYRGVCPNPSSDRKGAK